jgi:hypothetical protein
VPPYILTDFVVPAAGCSRSVTDFWGWGAHRVQLRYSDGVSDDTYECRVPGGTLNLMLQATRPWSLWGSYPARQNSHSGTGNRTRDLKVSSQKFWSPSHKAGLFVRYNILEFSSCYVDLQNQNRFTYRNVV